MLTRKSSIALTGLVLILIVTMLLGGCLNKKDAPAEDATAPAAATAAKSEKVAEPTNTAPPAAPATGKLIISNYIGDAELVIGGNGKSPNGEPLEMGEHKVPANGKTTIELPPGDYNWYVNTGSAQCSQCTAEGWVQIFAGKTAKFGFYVDMDTKALKGGAE